MTVDVIFPAGGRISGSFAEEAGAEVKALIRFRDGTLLENLAKSVRASEEVNRMVVIGPEAVRPHAEQHADAVLPEGDSGPENIFQGLRWLQAQPKAADRVLILTTDLPFLTPQSVSAFLEASPSSADISLPVFRKEEFEAAFPGSSNTYVRLKDGLWTIGCAFLLRRQALERNRRHIDELFQARKSALAMARLLGPVFIARYLGRRLRIHHLEAHCQRLTGFVAAAVHGCDPALAFDIDEVADLRYARERAGGIRRRPESATT